MDTGETPEPPPGVPDLDTLGICCILGDISQLNLLPPVLSQIQELLGLIPELFFNLMRLRDHLFYIPNDTASLG